MEKYPIDFIITWVDGNDLEWQKRKSLYQNNNGDNRARRYREWDNLKYLFRGIEKNAPWVNKVFLVTCGQIPNWLNIDNPKLVLVNHEDYIPSEFLPTFSSRTIDMNFHRIDELAEHFVYFNDDMFLVSPVKKSDFFHKGLPRDTAILEPVAITSGSTKGKEKLSQVYASKVFNIYLINKYFDKKKVIRKNMLKWYSPKYGKKMLKTLSLFPWNNFPGIRIEHCCYSYLKSTYKEVWNLEEENLNEVCSHKFRTNTDWNHWIFSEWQMAKGTFSPRKPGFAKLCSISSDEEKNKEVFRAIKTGNHKLVCVNDNVDSDDDFERLKKELNGSLEMVLPDKSTFEK